MGFEHLKNILRIESSWTLAQENKYFATHIGNTSGVGNLIGAGGGWGLAQIELGLVNASQRLFEQFGVFDTGLAENVGDGSQPAELTIDGARQVTKKHAALEMASGNMENERCTNNHGLAQRLINLEIPVLV